MFGRQKVLLALLETLGRQVNPTVFVKMVFLLREETALREGCDFYDFVPYRYGPFSFALYRDLAGLRRADYVLPEERSVELAPATRQLTLDAIRGLSDDTRRAVRSLVAAYGEKSQDSLLRTVYSKYPWYAVRSELKHLVLDASVQPLRAETAIYTAGYEGQSVDSFFNRLLKAGIQCLVDVRANPISRKYGFAKKSLSEISSKLGLEYCHFPELGIPSDQRVSLTSRNAYERLLDRYESEMLPTRQTAVRRLSELLHTTASVLVCMERDAAYCHRGRLAKTIARRTELRIVHL